MEEDMTDVQNEESHRKTCPSMEEPREIQSCYQPLSHHRVRQFQFPWA